MADSSNVDGGIGSLIGSIVGNQQASGDRGTAKDLVNQAIEQYQNINAPTDLTNKINLQQYASAGNLTPAQEQTINAAPSQAALVKANPQLQQAQMQALNSLQSQANTGMTSADKARLNSLQQQTNINNQGQQQAILQNFAQRGLGGSGNELLAKLQQNQSAANQANQNSLNVAGQAQQNALSALGQSGSLAGQMSNQQYQQQAQSANAADQLNRFNVQNQQAQQSRNVANQNAAQQYNLQNQQGISNSNVGQANQEQQRQKTAEQQQYEDQLQKASGLTNASFQGANAYNNMGNQTAQQDTNIGSGIGNIVGGSGGFSGIANSIGSFFADGGEVNGDDLMYGGSTEPNSAPNALTSAQAPAAPSSSSSGDSSGGLLKALPMLAMLAAEGGKVEAPTKEQKAKVPGNSYDNDLIDAKLSEGEVVIPRSIMESEDPPHNAKKMIERILKEKKGK